MLFSRARVLLLMILLLSGYQASAKPLDLASDEFPIAAYSVETPNVMKLLKDSGIQYVHTYSIGSDSSEKGIAKCLRYMDAANKQGLKVMFNLRGKHWVRQNNGLAEMMKIVRAVKDHPAMGFWYLYDEPTVETASPKTLKPFYEALKKETPNIPVAIVNCWDKSWQKYGSVLDLQMVDHYPVRAEPFPSNIRHITNFVDAALRLGKPVMAVYQCFNWGKLATAYNKKRKTILGKPVEQFRDPKPVELRYFCFSGLAQGVRGTCWWSIFHGYNPDGKWMKENFLPVTRDFAEFVKLVKPAHKPTILKSGRDEDFYMATWKRPTGEYLIIVNALPIKRECKRGLEGHFKNATLTPIVGTRKTSAVIKAGVVSGFEVEPWETMVWKVQETKPTKAQ